MKTFGAFIPFITWLIAGLLMSLWTDRTLDFLLTYFKGETVDVPLWLSAICSIALSGIIFPINVLTEIFRLFV